MFKNFIFSFKKSKILSRIAKNETQSIDLSNLTKSMGSKSKIRTELMNDLFNLLEKDIQTDQLLKHYNCDFEDLRKIITTLEVNGAGQLIKGHYVPFSAISFLDTLQILLQYWNGENFQVNDFDEYNSNLFISNKMLTSF